MAVNRALPAGMNQPWMSATPEHNSSPPVTTPSLSTQTAMSSSASPSRTTPGVVSTPVPLSQKPGLQKLQQQVAEMKLKLAQNKLNNVKKAVVDPVQSRKASYGAYLNRPPRSFESMQQYCTLFTDNLYEESTYEYKRGYIIDTPEQDEKDPGVYHVRITYTPDLASNIPVETRGFIKQPFPTYCAVFITDKNGLPAAFQVIASSLAHADTEIVLSIKAYPWTTDPFVDPCGALKILLGSPQVSRVMNAMLHIWKLGPESFQQKLLLGKERIDNDPLEYDEEGTSPYKVVLNKSQKKAAQHSMNNAVTLIRGPPGTGKTSTIFALIVELVAKGEIPVVIAAASNVAVDNIGLKLLRETNIDFLRVVSGSKEGTYKQDNPLSSKLLHLMELSELAPAHRQTHKMLQTKKQAQCISLEDYRSYMNSRKASATAHMVEVPVILTTTVSSGGRQFVDFPYVDTVIMDESTQSSEAISLVLLARPGVRRAVFVGDEKQLGALTVQPFLEQSLFQRVMINGSYKDPELLDTQYRMHSSISAFSNKRFYSGLLKDGAKDSDKTIVGLGNLIFIDYGNSILEEGTNRGTVSSSGEASLVCNILLKLTMTMRIDRRRISIITPYAGQRELLAKMIQKHENLNPRRKKIDEDVDIEFDGSANEKKRKKMSTVKTIDGLTVCSVDAFQGRENDIIIFACVRSNPHGDIGFMVEERRLNVALTRARQSLIVVGNAGCLTNQSGLWKEFVKHAHTNGHMMSPRDFLLR